MSICYLTFFRVKLLQRNTEKIQQTQRNEGIYSKQRLFLVYRFFSNIYNPMHMNDYFEYFFSFIYCCQQACISYIYEEQKISSHVFSPCVVTRLKLLVCILNINMNSSWWQFSFRSNVLTCYLYICHRYRSEERHVYET